MKFKRVKRTSTADTQRRLDNPCLGLKELIRWQSIRYRKAIEEDRWYMSQNEHRFIAWAEAELDFIRHNTYGCADQWRREFCSRHCPHRDCCELARRFGV